VSASEHARRSEDVGAYLLGALPELEALAFERHVMACAECRDELERLRPAVEAVARSPEQFEPSPRLRKSLMAAVRDDAAAGAPGRATRFRLPRLTLRWPQLAGAVAAAALIAVVIGVSVDSSSERTVRATARLPGATAELRLVGDDAQLRVSGLPVLSGNRVYEVWIEHEGRVRPAGALFEVHSNGSGAAAIPRRVEDGDRVMVTRERAGGAARPTEMPIIVARV
jgi:Anti-sigma-K factor rskA, C-terminal/Putative zinc-finger